MSEFKIENSTTPDKVNDFTVDSATLDSPAQQNETTWDNSDFKKLYGIYSNVAKVKKSIDAFATWVLGKGFTTDNGTQVILEKISGWGEDTFQSILWNLLVTKKFNGDAFAEIIRNPETGTLINIKPISPEFVRTIVDKKGIIIRYELLKPDREGVQSTLTPDKMLHLCNDRVGDQIHGTSVIEGEVEWIVQAQSEAMRDYRKLTHRNGVARVIEVDTDDTTKITSLKKQWKDAIEKGDVMILPKGVAEVKDSGVNIPDPTIWLNYLDNYFYIAIGIPKSILGGIEATTEAGGKISYLTFEQIYTRETTELEADILSQLAIDITFNKATSLKEEVQTSDAANTSQTGFQPNDTQAGVGE